MRFYESEAKRLLAKLGLPIPQGKLAKSAADAERIATELGGAVVLKAQVLGPALRRSGSQKTARNAAEAKKAADALLALDDGGRKPDGVLVEQQLAAEAEYAIAFTYDGSRKLPVVMAVVGSGEVEVIGDEHPEKVRKRHFSALYPFSDYVAKELVASLGLGGSDLTRMTGVVSRLARLFLDHDLTQLDVSRLVKSGDGKFVIADCYMELEAESRFRQKPTLDELGIRIDDPRAVREPTEFELAAAKIDADDPRGIISPVAEFDGNIGLVIGAGGGSLTLTDAVRKHGGKPANYAAIGGNPSVRKAEALTKLVLSKPGVEKIAVMSNVVSNTRADLVARGVIKGVIDLGFKPSEKIVIFRVPGAWEADAAKILEKYGVEYCDRTVSMSEAARRAVEKIGR